MQRLSYAIIDDYQPKPQPKKHSKIEVETPLITTYFDILTLPIELLLKIFTHLEDKEILNVLLVSKDWRNFLINNVISGLKQTHLHVFTHEEKQQTWYAVPYPIGGQKQGSANSFVKLKLLPYPANIMSMLYSVPGFCTIYGSGGFTAKLKNTTNLTTLRDAPIQRSIYPSIATVNFAFFKVSNEAVERIEQGATVSPSMPCGSRKK